MNQAANGFSQERQKYHCGIAVDEKDIVPTFEF
jgi:hypothetical protein